MVRRISNNKESESDMAFECELDGGTWIHSHTTKSGKKVKGYCKIQSFKPVDFEKVRKELGYKNKR